VAALFDADCTARLGRVARALDLDVVQLAALVRYVRSGVTARRTDPVAVLRLHVQFRTGVDLGDPTFAEAAIASGILAAEDARWIAAWIRMPGDLLRPDRGAGGPLATIDGLDASVLVRVRAVVDAGQAEHAAAGVPAGRVAERFYDSAWDEPPPMVD
jgi:hypothetical protein